MYTRKLILSYCVGINFRANPRIDYRQTPRKPKEYGRVHAISLNNYKILDT